MCAKLDHNVPYSQDRTVGPDLLGSGSQREKFQNDNNKKCKEIGNNCYFIQIFNENLHKLHFLTCEQSFMFFDNDKVSQKTGLAFFNK